jgi:hypothetical protein
MKLLLGNFLLKYCIFSLSLIDLLRKDRDGQARRALMIVWLWDAGGSGQFRGVAGDDHAARRAAAQCITSGAAETATVEAASLMIGLSSLTDCYHRTGTGWTARRSGAGVGWAALTAGGQAAS